MSSKEREFQNENVKGNMTLIYLQSNYFTRLRDSGEMVSRMSAFGGGGQDRSTVLPLRNSYYHLNF